MSGMREGNIQNKSLFLAIDQGSQSSRAMVFDHLGAMVASGSKPIATYHPEEGWVEHNPEEVVDSVQYVIEMVMHSLGQRAPDLVAAGLAAQRSSLVCWDRESCRALSQVISWQDRRRADLLASTSPHFRKIHGITGLFPSAHYGASKMRWCLDNLSSVQRALKQGRLIMGPLASFLAFRLLSEQPVLIDPANASRTLLFNLQALNWDAGLLELFGISDQVLPRCVPTAYSYGQLNTGGRALPLKMMNGDLPAALFACGSPQPDSAYIQLGTGAFVQISTGDSPVFSERYASGIVLSRESGNSYVLEGSVNGAGSALAWLEYSLNQKDMQKKLPEWLDRGGDVPLFLNGVSGLGSPYWLADFETRFVGSGAPWQMAVAVIESIVFLLHTNLDGMVRLPLNCIRLGGGLSGMDGLCQRLADLSGLPVERPAYTEATARGTAWLLTGSSDPWPERTKAKRFLPGKNSDLRHRYHRWLGLMPQKTVD